jgi:Protein of unknown function (DUF2726)
MTDKAKRRAREYASKHPGVSHQAAVNQLRRPIQALLNESEKEVEVKLEGVAGRNGARVYSKVRFADVARIEHSGISDEAYRYALQSHLDFVVTDRERHPLFAVEFDGLGHDGRGDALKNELCARFDLPLARVEHRHLKLVARGLGAIPWLAELFFTYRDMEQAQKEGAIPFDEPIDPFMIYSWERNNEKFPLCFSIKTSLEAHRLCDAGKIPTPYPFQVAFGDGGRARAMATLRVAKGRFLAVTESLYLQGFGVGPGEASRELAAGQLLAMMRAHVQGEDVSFSASVVFERLASVAASGVFLMGGHTEDPDDFRLAHIGPPGGPASYRIVPPSDLVH